LIDLLKQVLLESPSKLALLVFFWLLVCLIAWRRWRTDRARRVFLWAALVSVVLFALQALVTTDREQIRNVIEELADAVAKQNLPVVISHIDPDCTITGRSGDHDAHAVVQAQLRRIGADEPFLRNVTINTTGDDARVSLTAFCRPVVDGEPVGFSSSVWRLQFRRRSGEWKVVGIKLITIGGHPAAGLWEIAPR
jgi:hypothetical protein